MGDKVSDLLDRYMDKVLQAQKDGTITSALAKALLTRAMERMQKTAASSNLEAWFLEALAQDASEWTKDNVVTFPRR